MTAPCPSPLAWDDLVAYWAGDLEPDQTARLDEHLMACDACSASSAQVAAVTEGLRAMIPAFLSHARLDALRARGVWIVDNPVVASQPRTAVLPRGADVLLHRLEVDLAHAAHVEVMVTDETDGEVLLVDPRVPFDPGSGEILVACQRHFGAGDRTIVFDVRVHAASGATQVARFAIPHVFEQ